VARSKKPENNEAPTAKADGKILRPGQSYQGIEYRGKNKDGQDVWRILVYAGDQWVETPDGKRKRVVKTDKHTFTGTFRDAKKFKAKLEAERQEGTYTPPTKETVAGYLRQWLDTTARRALRPSTHSIYEIIANKHIIPALGHIRLQKLDSTAIDKFYTSLEGKLAPASILKIHTILLSALSKAKDDGLIKQNPAKNATPPRVEASEITVLTQEQLDRLLETAKGTRIYALLYTLAYTGLRLGEALQLRWSDVDLDRRVLYVLRQAKTKSSIRAVSLDDDVVAVLRQHKEEQDKIKEIEGERYQDMGLVFATERGTPPSPSHLRNRYLYPLCAKAGVPRVNFHALRHTHASLLMAANVHPKIISERLGHASIETTADRYQHLFPTLQAEALEQYKQYRRKHSNRN